VKGLTAFEAGKVEFSDLPRSDHPVTAVSPEMLQRDDAIVPEDGHNTTLQLDLSLLILKVNNHIIRDLRYWKVCVRWAHIGTSHLTIKQREKPFLLSCRHVLKLREIPYARLLQQMVPGSTFNWKRTFLHKSCFSTDQRFPVLAGHCSET